MQNILTERTQENKPETKPEIKTITLRLPASLWLAAKLAALHSDVPVSHFAIRALAEKLGIDPPAPDTNEEEQ